MKNTFKFFGAMLLASLTVFTACNPGEDVNPINGKTRYTLTVNVNDPTMGTAVANPAGAVDSGSAVTLTATANAEYEFVNWTMPDGTTSQNNPLVVVATANATYTANFVEQTGVKVTFGNTSWDAAYTNAQYSQGAFMILSTQTTNTQAYPWVEVGFGWDGTPSTGVYTGQPTVDIAEGTAQKGNPYLWYYTESDNMQLGGKACGDYWNKTLTLNVTAFDATALTISLLANATMGYLPECLEGTEFANASEQTCTMKVSNVRLTPAKKNLMADNGAAKFARR